MTAAVTASPESRLEIERLVYDYADCVDDGNFDGVARLFAHGRITGPDGSTLAEGYDGMLAFYRETLRVYPPNDTPLTQHVITNLVLDIDEESDAATGRCHYTVFQKIGDEPLQAIITGRYRDSFRRADGIWRFSERQMLPTLIGDMKNHVTRFA